MADLQPAMQHIQAQDQGIGLPAPPFQAAPIVGGAPLANGQDAQPVAAAAIGGAPPIFQALPRHSTFASWFSDTVSDPNHDDAFRVLQSFNPSNAAPLTGAALKQAVLGQTSPNTFLCCAALNGVNSRVYLVHSLSRYPLSLNGRPTPWDNRIIGFLGDVVGGSAMNIILPEEIFDETPETLVYNAETLNEELPELGVGEFFPRVRANADNAVLRKSRYLMYFPTRYASLLLNNKGYSIKDVWVNLFQRFQDNNIIDQMGPVLAWLRLTLHATGQYDTGPPVTQINLTAPFIDQDLSAHRLPFRQVLQGLQPQVPGLEAAIVQFATAS
jgi:hypothetical protein